MELQFKLSLLDQIYGIYEEHISIIDVACEKECATCCTRNVTMTSLEGQRFVSGLTDDQKKELMAQINKKANKNRFQPKLTINQLADLCMNGEEIPEEDKNNRTEACDFLDHDLCSVYPARPFHCRCMVSKTRCSKLGYANMGEYTLTINNLFLQIIEHVDSDGYTGNLVDVLLFLNSGIELKNEEIRNQIAGRFSLIPNRPAKMLLIPPEHRQRVNPLLKRLENVFYKIRI